MNKIFIEAEKAETSECEFLKAVLSKHFPGKESSFVCMAGVDNLFNESILNQMRLAQEEGDNVIVLLDADTPDKGYGFTARLREVTCKMKTHDIHFSLFVYPNNANDGDVESLMECSARKDLHKKWWDCFEDYETCISGVTDNSGEKRYITPNLKAKLHSFISSQKKLNNKERHKLGSGQWLFDNLNYWNLSDESLSPLITFFRDNLK